jgi:hypothetical protein
MKRAYRRVCPHFYLTERGLSPDQLDLIDASTLLSSG